MRNVELKNYRATEIVFNNKLENQGRVELGNTYSYNVSYSDGNVCKGVFSIEVFDKNAQKKFNVKVTVEGIFSFNTDLEKEKIHVATFKELFPYARALVVTITTNAGVPPIYLPNIDIEAQEIYRFEKNT
ncbi:MAG: protein-export chaperone SecB [Oscillospiraceae bacterium]|nr:protein-export chaperone SecB [Oscillospiraceae bacterium]